MSHKGDGLRPVPFRIFALFGGLLAASTCPGQECVERIARAQQAVAAKQIAVAVSELEAAASRCPPDVAILLPLGQMQYLLGKDVDAERSLQAALRLDANHEEALYALGRVYAMQNRFPEAVDKFLATVKVNPKNYKAWDNLGVVYDGMNQESDALRCFFKALDLVMKDHPDYDWAHANLADFFLRRNQFEKAFQLASEAARRNPSSPRNCFLTAKALVQLDKHELSLRWAERAVELDPAYSEALYLLSQTYRKLGRTKEAAETLERFKEANKNRPARR